MTKREEIYNTNNYPQRNTEKLNIEQHEPHKYLGVNTDALEGSQLTILHFVVW